MSKTEAPLSVAGASLSIGAGLGATLGVLVAGGPGVAIGACLGAAMGIVVGAAWDAFHSGE
jgi:hypothetical protein